MINLTKADYEFLKSVNQGRVRRTRGYTARRGGYEQFYGGEVRAKKLSAAGLINIPGIPELGRPTFATLTSAGRAALEARDAG